MAMAMAGATATSKPLIYRQLTNFTWNNMAPRASFCHCLAYGRINFRRQIRFLSVVASASTSQGQSSGGANGRLELSFAVGAHLIPHPDKADKGGEDALFVSNYNGGVLAVADGVSGWAEDNVDPSLFPRELMANALSAIGDDEVNNDPQQLLQKAHATTYSIGSATVIIAMLEKNGTLKIASVGDCGLRILRKGRVIFCTSAQEHYFDCPFQLCSGSGGQTYKDAAIYNIEVVEGDTVVMGSDGLFDNVFDHEIECVVNRFGASNPNVANKVAEALADLASRHARDTDFESPYCLEARIKGYDVPMWKKLLGLKFTGGKLDDITVIVATVVNARILLQGGDVHFSQVKDFPNAFYYTNQESLLKDECLTKEVQPKIKTNVSNQLISDHDGEQSL